MPLAFNPSYNPLIDILNFNLLPISINQPNDVFLSNALFTNDNVNPSGLTWQASNYTPDGTTYSSIGGGPGLFFEAEDRPAIVSATIFCNFADGLIFQPSDQGGNLLDLQFLTAPFLNLNGTGDTQANHFTFPALNTELDVGHYARRMEILPTGVTGTPVSYWVPYISFGLTDSVHGMHFLTTLIDSTLNGQKVWFNVKIKIAHTLPMVNAVGGRSL